jgi:hypothetical protein
VPFDSPVLPTMKRYGLLKPNDIVQIGLGLW